MIPAQAWAGHATLSRVWIEVAEVIVEIELAAAARASGQPEGAPSTTGRNCPR